MFCEKCGTKLEEDALFCDNCGAKVADMVKVQPEIVNVATPRSETNPAPQQPIPNGQPLPYVQPVPTAHKPPMSKAKKIMIAEILVLVVALFALYKIGTTRFGAGYVAENYAKAKMAGDWDAVYDMLNLSSSELLSKELFLSSRNEEELLEVANYTFEEEKNDSNNFRKVYNCEYLTNGNSYSNSEKIQVVKQRDKQWLLFDQWEVTPDDLIAEEVRIMIPKDATLKLNGVDVSGAAGVKTEEYYGNLEYSLPALFKGIYVVEVSAPGRQTISQEIQISGYYSGNYTSMLPDPAVIDSLAEKTIALHTAFIQATMEGTPYEGFLSENEDLAGDGVDFYYDYESFQEQYTNSDRYLYDQISVRNVEASMDNYGIDSETGNMYIKMYVHGDLSVEGAKVRENWWTGEITYEPYTETNNYHGYCTYQLLDGEWVLSNFSK